MNTPISSNNLAWICLCIIGGAATIFFADGPRNGLADESRPEAWRSLDVDESTKAFDATGSRTNFLTAASDDGGQHLILGVSHVGNGVPWLASLSDD